MTGARSALGAGAAAEVGGALVVDGEALLFGADEVVGETTAVEVVVDDRSADSALIELLLSADCLELDPHAVANVARIVNMSSAARIRMIPVRSCSGARPPKCV